MAQHPRAWCGQTRPSHSPPPPVVAQPFFLPSSTERGRPNSASLCPLAHPVARGPPFSAHSRAMLPPCAAQLPSPPLCPTARPRVAQELATRLPHLLAPPALAAQRHTPRPPGQLSPARPQPMPPMLPCPSRTTRMSPCGQVAQPPPEPCSSSQSISFSSCRAHVASPSLKQPVPTSPRTPSACASSSLPYFISLVANTPSGRGRCRGRPAISPFTAEAPMPQSRRLHILVHSLAPVWLARGPSGVAAPAWLARCSLRDVPAATPAQSVWRSSSLAVARVVHRARNTSSTRLAVRHRRKVRIPHLSPCAN